jgi:hypothetical protein
MKGPGPAASRCKRRTAGSPVPVAATTVRAILSRQAQGTNFCGGDAVRAFRKANPGELLEPIQRGW